MVRAYQVMTRAVATVSPSTPVSQVATTMRDLNIGDVLVVEEGQLRGIVTDRDLAIQALTNGGGPNTPVEIYMTRDIVTGEPDWTLEQVADVMGANQVRRLPIVDHGQLVGIVSLGDVAVHAQKSKAIAESLKNISEPLQPHYRSMNLTRWIGIAVPIAVVATALVLANTKSGKRMRRQLEESDLTLKARDTLLDAVKTLQDPHTREAALEALSSSGLSERARETLASAAQTLQDLRARDTLADAGQALHDLRARETLADAVHTLQGSHPRETAHELAAQARRQARGLSRDALRYARKRKTKRRFSFS